MQDDSKQEAVPAIIRRARRAKGLTQMALASQAGCTQSALSMLEMGRMTALSRETLQKIADILGIQLPESDADAGKAGLGGGVSYGVPPIGRMICPNPLCLSNHPYFVGDELFFLPNGMAGNGHHCALCGEVMLAQCPHCGSTIRQAGGCCSVCGQPLVSLPDGMFDNPRAWAQAHRAEIAALRAAQTGAMPASGPLTSNPPPVF